MKTFEEFKQLNEGKFTVSKNKIKAGGKELDIPGDQYIVFDNTDGSMMLKYRSHSKDYYADFGSWDKSFDTLKDVVDYLNKEGYKFAGYERF